MWFKTKKLERLSKPIEGKTSLNKYLSLRHILVTLWSVSLSFLVMALTGTTSFLSNLMGANQIPLAVDITFFILSGIFAVILWRFFSHPHTILAKILAFLPPFLIFIMFLL